MIFNHNICFLLGMLLLGNCAANAMSQPTAEELRLEARRQARSVHLWHGTADEPFPAAKHVSVSMTIRKSAPGSYFCALAFGSGYIGLQELSDGRRVAIFSVWDDGDPYDSKAHESNVPPDERTVVVKSGANVRVKRFSGEGTGAQAMMDFPWREGETYTFSVRAEKDGQKHVAFTGSVQSAGGEPFEMATFSTLSAKAKAQVSSISSFVEDFRRDFESAKKVRLAEFADVLADGKKLDVALFTGDRNPATNVDAGCVPGGFFLQTGGDTKNVHAPLGARMHPKK